MRKKSNKKVKSKSGCLKSLGIGFIIFFVLIIWIVIFTDSESNEFKYVHTAVNLRKGPGIDHDVIVTLSPGSKVEVIKKKGDWWKVKTEEVDSGYIYQALLQTDPKKEIEVTARNTKDLLKYSIHKEDVSDSPIKTQVALARTYCRK